MAMEINLFIWSMTATAFAYLFVMLIITSGWFRLKRNEGESEKEKPQISLVIALRNEEANITNLLRSIYNQDYPQQNIEVILVDDHSEDLTRKLIGKYRKENKIDNIVLTKPTGIGKKAAITHGVKLATGKLIVTTDGDCEMPEQWLSKMVDHFVEFEPGLIIGPVVYHQEKGLLQKLFSVDFLSLVASGAGSIGAGLPLMGNGANMAFSRKAFLKIEAEMQGGEFASGDDVFLIHQMTKNFGKKSIHFLKDADAIVRTKAPQHLRQFFSQRIRWASKAKGYRTLWSIVVPLVVSFFNLGLAAVFIGGFFETWLFAIFVLYILLKFLIDLPLLFDFMTFSNKRNLKLFVLPLQIIYPFYIVLTAFVSLFFRYEWKGRSGLR